MYRTPHGQPILLDAERRLFQAALGMMADLLSSGDCDFGVPVFDELQRGQKLFALYRAGRALLVPDEPMPELTAYLEGAVASVYRFALDNICQEIEEPDFATARPSWRRLVLDAVGDVEDIDEASTDTDGWEILIDSLQDAVLWDSDFEIEAAMDIDPVAGGTIKEVLGIPEDYFTAVPVDVPDEQLNLYLDALQGLTPLGRESEDG